MNAALRVLLLAPLAIAGLALAQPAGRPAQGGGVAMVALNRQPAAIVKGLGPASTIATGLWTSCAVVKRVPWCWGELAVFGAGGDRHVPRKMPVQDVTQLSVSRSGACALTSSGGVLCWGSGFGGGKPRKVSLPRATKVSAGNGFACALLKKGRVACWGANESGQLGQPLGSPRASTSAPPGAASQPLRRKGESAASATRRALREILERPSSRSPLDDRADGEPPPPHPPSSARPLVIPELDNVVDVAAGERHACAVRASGEVICWGDRNIERPDRSAMLPGGQRGPDRLLVIRTGERHRIPGISNAVAVSAGDRTSCVLQRGGQVSCWNQYTSRRALVGPSACVGLDDAVALSDHGWYAVRATGEVVRVGALGGCYQPRSEPGVTEVVEASSHCARRKDGAVVCWGTNSHGELGRPATPFYSR